MQAVQVTKFEAVDAIPAAFKWLLLHWQRLLVIAIILTLISAVQMWLQQRTLASYGISMQDLNDPEFIMTRTEEFMRAVGMSYLPFVVTMPLVFWPALATTIFMTEGAAGNLVPVGQALVDALRRLIPYTLFSLLFLLAVSFASILFLLPGLYLTAMWAVSSNVFAYERLGILASFGRSRQLTKGHRWPILGFFLVIMILASMIGGTIVMLGTFAALGPALFDANALASGAIETQLYQVGSLPWIIYMLAMVVANMVYYGLFVGFLTHIYAQLRSLEAGGEQNLKQVFS